MNHVAIIPARMKSSRFPGKPLKKILGIPMLEHVYRRANMFFDKENLFIATCDNKIKEFSKSINANFIMTSTKHLRASDRVNEALFKIEKIKKKKIDLIILLQGDEPLINPIMLKKALNVFYQDPSIQIANLMKQINNLAEIKDINEVKVIFDNNYNAINFSRLPIPFNHANVETKYYKQVCVIPFRRDFLLKYSRMKPTKYEICESIDMMRVIENGYNVKMIEIKDEVISVDTAKDLIKAIKILKKDRFTKKYIK